MPLKHTTETTLLLILAVVIALTGLLTATLPALPAGGLPWLILAGLALLYPLLLTPLFQSRRADTPFRWMHWIPLGILLIWFAIEAVALYRPEIARFQSYYTVAWTLPAVALGFLALIVYCFHVIRRRVPRVALIVLLLLVFGWAGITSVQGKQWDGELASVLWQGSWWQVFGSGAAVPAGYRSIAYQTASSSLAPSSDADESAWRDKMRSAEDQRSSSQVVAVVSSVPVMVHSSTSSTGVVWHQTSSKPTKLPSAGSPVEMLGLTLLALYTAVLHQRARRRCL